jgi:hypothetical protein
VQVKDVQRIGGARIMELTKWAIEHGATITTLPILPCVPVGEGPWKIYIYRPDGFHTGGKWFRQGKMKYPAEEITTEDARQRAIKAMIDHCEVRICNGDDRLVFHSENGTMIQPATFDEFWDAMK